MKVPVIAFVLLGLSVKGAYGQAGPQAADPAGSLHAALAKSTPQFRSLLNIIKVAPAAVPKSTLGTFFAPNDAAVAAFLKSMGLTAKSLESKPELVDLIVAYHFVPGYQVTGTEFAKGSKRVATGDDNYILRLNKGSGGKLSVQDVQGNKANVISGPIKAGKVNVYVIDKVLLSGGYFTNTLSALKHYPSWVTTYGLITQTGIDKALLSQTTGYTLFVPSVKAWKPVEPQVTTMANVAIADYLKYHVVPGARQVPRDFKNGTLPTLLTGHDLKVETEPKRTEYNPYTRNMELQPLVRITSEAGTAAEIQTYNIFAGKNILHGINKVLVPDMSKAVVASVNATNTAAAAKPAAATAAVKASPAPAAVANQSKVAVQAATRPQPTTTSLINTGLDTITNTTSTTAASTINTAVAAAASTTAATTAAVQTLVGRRLQTARKLLQPIKALELGTTQTDAAAVEVGKTLEALTAAAAGVMPVQYRNRFGSFGTSTEADGCLNCVEWVKG